MSKIKLREYDAAEFLDTEEKISAYLSSELAEGDPHYINVALKNIARARQMTELAKKMNISRDELFEKLSDDVSIDLPTIERLVNVLEIKSIEFPKKLATANA